jgi:hypothetical protein
VRRYVSVVLLVALALLVFAPAALAQEMGDEMMMEDEMMMSSASASASAMSSASASAMMEEEMMGSASASASASATASALPTSGGPRILPLLSVAALAVVVGSGLVAARLVRSNS